MISSLICFEAFIYLGNYFFKIQHESSISLQDSKFIIYLFNLSFSRQIYVSELLKLKTNPIAGYLESIYEQLP